MVSPGIRSSMRGGCGRGDSISHQHFILVMDVLTAIFCRAEEKGIFEPLHRWGVKHRISIYVGDVAMFVRPMAEDLLAPKQLVSCFGDVSGL
jgi:hypothetical protein